MTISISPAITTTPAHDSLFPIYWEDLTEEEKADGKLIPCETQSLPAGVYTIRVAPTSEWYATDGDTVGEKGAEIELQMEVDEDESVLSINVSALSQNPAETEDFDTCSVTLSIFKR